jgi:ribosomal RNA methyltransferase Nop2
LKAKLQYTNHISVDGFFVAKFKKIGPTPPNAVGANGSASTGKPASNGQAVEEEYVDKTPIEELDKEESDFGGFDEEEDQMLMERAQRNELRRKGKNPKAVLYKAKGEAQTKKADDASEDQKVDDVSEGKKADVVAEGKKADGVSKSKRADGASKGKKADGVSKDKRVNGHSPAGAAKSNGVNGKASKAEANSRRKSGSGKGKAQ